MAPGFMAEEPFWLVEQQAAFNLHLDRDLRQKRDWSRKLTELVVNAG